MAAISFDDMLAPPASAPASGAITFDDLVPARLETLTKAVTDIPSKVYDAGSAAISSVTDAFNPNSDANKARMEAEKNKPFYDISGEIGGLGQTAKMLTAPIAGIGNVIMAAPKNVIARTYDAAAPSFTPGQTADMARSGVTLPSGEQVADTALSALAPGRGGLPAEFGPQVAAPVSPIANGPLGVTLSKGQATGELPLIQREQAALRGTAGAPVQKRAQEFADQQTQEVSRAKEAVAQSLDPARQIIAETPQEAGQAVSSGVRGAADAAKTNVNAAYTTARDLGGEIHPTAFENMPQEIKSDLTNAPEPVVIDPGSTPNASKMLDYLDSKIGNLDITNKANPGGTPKPTTETRTILSGPGYHIADDVTVPPKIVGVNLDGVDQWRKQLGAFRRDAFGTNNAADQRAVKAVMDAFDSRIDRAINGGMFTGDPLAVKAWNTARAANADYRSTFSGSPKDAAGRVIEKIIGKGQNPAAIPNDVADFLYGSSGVNPGSLNVSVANRVKNILGESSPEWSAVRQGLFSRLVEPSPGMTDFGPGKVAQRVNRFLNGDGKELANTLYRPHERALVQQYADLMRQLEVPQAGANWSNTATFSSKVLKKTGHLGELLGLMIGGAIGHHTGLPGFIGEAVGAAAGAGVAKSVGRIGDAVAVRSIGKQMPLIRTAAAQYQKALSNYNKMQTPPAKTSLAVASTNLARSLRPLGISLENFGTGIGAMNAPAEQQQN